jgi:hypothetical protein
LAIAFSVGGMTSLLNTPYAIFSSIRTQIKVIFASQITILGPKIVEEQKLF